MASKKIELPHSKFCHRCAWLSHGWTVKAKYTIYLVWYMLNSLCALKDDHGSPSKA